VAALYGVAGRRVPLPCGRRMEVLRKKLAVLLAMAMMLAMMLASTGTASAVALANGKGGEKANANAAFGIGTAVVNTQKHDCGLNCE
jgi:hypothetical protein